MCGIVGVINRSKNVKDGDKLRDFFQQALFVDSLRGKHGTGIIAVNNKGNVETFKKPMPSPDFLDLKTTRDIISKTTNTFLVGHNRWATTGAHTIPNTHPFSHGSIHMVHNGTLDMYKGLTPGKSFDVDSEAIAYLLSQEQTKTVLEKIEGAYSLVWFDEEGNSLNFARNNDRPMYLAKVDAGDSLVFASEKGMIEWICSRLNLKIEKIFSLKVGVLLSFQLNPAEDISTIEFTPKVRDNYYQGYNTYIEKEYKYSKLKKLKGIRVRANSWTPYANAGGHPTQRYGSLAGTYDDGIADPCKVTISSMTEADSVKYIGKDLMVKVTSVTSDVSIFGVVIKIIEDDDVIEGEITSTSIVPISQEFRLGPGNRYIPLARWTTLTKNGCSNCSSTLTDPDDIHWDIGGNPFCLECFVKYEVN